MGKFLQRAFSEPDGTPSFSRFSSAVLIVVVIIWVSYLIRLNHTLPDLSGASLLIGTPYGINRMGRVMEGWKNGRKEDTEPDSGPPENGLGGIGS